MIGTPKAPRGSAREPKPIIDKDFIYGKAKVMYVNYCTAQAPETYDNAIIKFFSIPKMARCHEPRN